VEEKEVGWVEREEEKEEKEVGWVEATGRPR
jgi:hypothetical protein